MLVDALLCPVSLVQSLNGRNQWKNGAKLWELITHRCVGQSCLNLVFGVLKVEGVCTTSVQ